MADLVRISPSFALHGAYVGPGHTGAQSLGDVDFRTEPVDRLDAAARVHDWQYTTQPDNRGAADRVLARSAWEAATDPSLPISTRAKALFVAGGMRLMSSIGSQSGRPLQYPQTARNHRAFGVRQAMSRHSTAIVSMGSHGEPTETDDLSASTRGRRGQGVMQPLPRAQNRRSASTPPARSQQRPVANQRPPPPTPTQQMGPTARQLRRAERALQRQSPSTVFATGIPIVSQRNNVIERISVRGFKVKLQELITPASIGASGQVLFSFTIDRRLFARTALKPLFQMFNHWRNQGITLEVVPALATNTAGNLQSVADTDATDVQPNGTILDEAFFSGHGRKSLEHSAFGAPWQVSLPPNSRSLFTDINRVTNAPGVTTDPRISSAGVITIAAATGFTITSTTIGSLYVVFNGDFSVGDFSEDDGVLVAVKAQALSGSSILGAGTSATVSSLINSVRSSTPNAGGVGRVYSEYAYDPAGFDGTTFHLPKGVYSVKFFIGFTGNPGPVTTTVGFIGAPTYSSDWVATSSATNANAPEFASSPGGLATQVGSAQWMGTIRCTVPSAGSNTFDFQPSWTWTNSVSVLTLQVMIERKPTVLAEPFLAQFPLGSSGSMIEMKTEASTHPMENVSCAKLAPKHITVSSDDYQAFLNFQHSRSLALPLDVIDEKTPPPMPRTDHLTATSSNASWFNVRR